jgi:hypothetical protein
MCKQLECLPSLLQHNFLNTLNIVELLYLSIPLAGGGRDECLLNSDP